MFLAPVHRSVAAPSGIIRNGLVGRWPLQEGSGGTAFDDSGNGNNGALTNYDLGSCWVAGPGVGGLTGALQADASNEFVDLGMPAVLMPTAALTICIWGYWNSITAGHIFSANTSTVRGWGFHNGTRGHLGDGTSDYYLNLSMSNPSTGNWYHLALTFDGSWGRLYRNGSETDSHNKVTTLSYTGVSMIKINGRSDRPSEGHIGRVADARVYDRALSGSEISDIWSGNG